MENALQKDLDTLKSIYDFSYLFSVEMSTKNIVSYYKKNKYLFYRLMAKSKSGMMHMGLSDDGICLKNKFYGDYQVKYIDKLIKEKRCKSVLEIGSGQGANLLYLAKRNQECSFYGVDLYPSIDKSLENVTLLQGDYHDLSKMEKHSMDLVYGIETLCYSINKDQVFQEVHRVLKKGGLFVLFDGYANKERENLTDLEKEVTLLTEKGWVLDCFEYVHYLDKYALRNGFSILKKEDMKPKLQAHVDSYKERLDQVFHHKYFCKWAFSFVPKEVLGNLVPVYFLSNGIRNDLFCYYQHVFEKK